jgi:hypothetical protein
MTRQVDTVSLPTPFTFGFGHAFRDLEPKNRRETIRLYTVHPHLDIGVEWHYMLTSTLFSRDARVTDDTTDVVAVMGYRLFHYIHYNEPPLLRRFGTLRFARIAPAFTIVYSLADDNSK